MQLKKYYVVILIFVGVIALALLTSCGNDSIPANDPSQVDGNQTKTPGIYPNVFSFCSRDQHGYRIYVTSAGFISVVQDDTCS